MRQQIAIKGFDEEAMLEIEKVIQPLVGRVRKRVSRLPAGLVVLHGLVERHRTRALSRASLSLRLPSRTLAAHEEAEHAGPAVRAAFHEVERLLEKEKARLRRSREWRGPATAVERRLLERVATDAAEGDWKRSRLEELAGHAQAVEAYLRREIALLESADELCAGEVDPDDLLDAALLRAIEEPDERPPGLAPSRWLIRLALDALRQELERLREERGSLVHLEEAAPGEAAEPESGALTEGESDGELASFPPVAGRWMEEIIPALGGQDPEQLESAYELERGLVAALSALPRGWREAFVLREHEGLEWDEMASITGRKVAELERCADLARAFLRDKLSETGFLPSDGAGR